MYMLWILILVFAIVIDIMTSQFLFVAFGISALVSIVLNAFGVSILIQIISFATIGIGLTLMFYPILKKKLQSGIPRIDTMEESYIGKQFLATEDIGLNGRVVINGIYWSAINEGEKILKDEKFRITGIRGTKFTIESHKGE